MISKEEREKNVRDLEYNNLLNKQNIAIILIGTLLISIILADNFSNIILKIGTIIILFLLGLIFLVYYSKRLEEKLKEIRAL